MIEWLKFFMLLFYITCYLILIIGYFIVQLSQSKKIEQIYVIFIQLYILQTALIVIYALLNKSY
jgi:hypothetical protein